MATTMTKKATTTKKKTAPRRLAARTSPSRAIEAPAKASATEVLVALARPGSVDLEEVADFGSEALKLTNEAILEVQDLRFNSKAGELKPHHFDELVDTLCNVRQSLRALQSELPTSGTTADDEARE